MQTWSSNRTNCPTKRHHRHPNSSLCSTPRKFHGRSHSFSYLRTNTDDTQSLCFVPDFLIFVPVALIREFFHASSKCGRSATIVPTYRQTDRLHRIHRRATSCCSTKQPKIKANKQSNCETRACDIGRQQQQITRYFHAAPPSGNLQYYIRAH